MADSGMRKVLRFRQAWRRVQKHGNSLHLTKIKGFFRPDRNISLHIHHFYMDHNNPFFSPKILHNHCFQFLLGMTVTPREIEDNGYAKFWGLKKVHYGLCENGELSRFSIILIVIFVVHINKLKKVSVYNQMATSEVANNFTHVLSKF